MFGFKLLIGQMPFLLPSAAVPEPVPHHWSRSLTASSPMAFQPSAGTGRCRLNFACEA